MPFKWKWPFRWPWSKAETRSAEDAAPTAPAPAAEPVQRAPAGVAVPPEPGAATLLAANDAPDHDLGTALLARLSAHSVPPTLDERGGLASMARALPEVDRFLQRLPASPAPTSGLIGPASDITSFAASLPGLGNLAAGTSDGAPGFPEQLEVRPVQTEILPPLGGLPDQVPGLSGAAPVLETPSHAAASVAAAAGLPAAAVQRQVVMPMDVAAHARTAPELTALALPVAPAKDTLSQAGAAPMTLFDSAPMGQVLAPEAVLTGNVLPPAEAPAAAVQREAEPLAPAPSGLTEFVRPAEATTTVERVTVIEREIIESQRGQGRPLPNETRTHFEQAYGQPLGDVRIHTGPTAQRLSESLNAAAFATGSDVFFAPGVFQPDQPAGLRVVGHELAHVIQQRYGPPSDVDALQPPSHPAERQAEALAARAVDKPMVAPTAGETPAPPIQRAAAGSEDPRLLQWPAWLQGEREEPEVLGRAERFEAPPLSTAALLGAEAAPVQRFSAEEIAGLRQGLSSETAVVQPLGTSAARPALENTPARVGGLTAALPNPGGMLANLNSAARNLPAQSFYNTTQIILGGGESSVPVLSRAVDLNALTDNLPGLPQMPDAPTLDSLAGQLSPPELPDVSSLAQGLPDRLPSLPTLDGLRLPEMPLAPSMGDLTQLAANAAATGQEAVGSVLGMAQSAVESAAAPALPNMEKLTEQIWKSIQQKLRVERERSRGLA